MGRQAKRLVKDISMGIPLMAIGIAVGLIASSWFIKDHKQQSVCWRDGIATVCEESPLKMLAPGEAVEGTAYFDPGMCYGDGQVVDGVMISCDGVTEGYVPGWDNNIIVTSAENVMRDHGIPLRAESTVFVHSAVNPENECTDGQLLYVTLPASGDVGETFRTYRREDLEVCFCDHKCDRPYKRIEVLRLQVETQQILIRILNRMAGVTP